MYIIAVVIILAISVGGISSYSTYVATVGKYNLTSFEECGEVLGECISAEKLTQTLYEECRSDLNKTLAVLEDISPIQPQLAECRELLSDLQEQLSSRAQTINALLLNETECEEDLIACQGILEECENIKEGLFSNITVCKGDFAALQADYDDLVENVADELCCIYQLGNPDLKYYYVKNDKIICTSEASETLGTKKFSC